MALLARFQSRVLFTSIIYCPPSPLFLFSLCCFYFGYCGNQTPTAHNKIIITINFSHISSSYLIPSFLLWSFLHAHQPRNHESDGFIICVRRFKLYFNLPRHSHTPEKKPLCLLRWSPVFTTICGCG